MDISAEFIETPHSSLFSVLKRPSGSTPKRIYIVLQAFAEEANKSRRMWSLISETVCDRGSAVLLFDYSSTGDSQGEFAEATLQNWTDDLCAVINVCQSRFPDVPLECIALRTGAIVYLEALKKLSTSIPGILIAPVTNGKQFISQFLRLRLAANMVSGEKKESMASLNQLLEQEGVIEVAGYALNKQLVSEISSFTATDACPSAEIRILDIVSDEGDGMSPAIQKIADSWTNLDVSLVCGVKFWATQEIAVNLSLVEWFRTFQERS